MDFKIIVCPKYSFVCITPHFSNECLCFMAPGGSRSLGRGWLFFLLEGIQTLYFPSFQFVRQNSNEAQGGGSLRCSSHSTMVANSTLVSTASPIIDLVSYPSAPVGRTSNFASEGFSTPSQRCNAPGRVACIRHNLQVRGISPRASSYVLKSWRPGSSIQRLGNDFVNNWCDGKSSSSRSRDSLRFSHRTTDLRALISHAVQLIVTDLHIPLRYHL